MAASPSRGGGGGQGEFFTRQPRAEDIPAEFRDRLGNVSAKQTLPQLKRFAEEGGVLVAFGGSATLGEQLGLPVRDHLVEMTAAGVERSLPRDKYYIPGSLLRVAVDNTNPVAWGMEREVDVMFDNSPVLHLGPEASLRQVRPAAWFAGKSTLRSGWAWGQHYLDGGAAAVSASLGRGKVYLFGPEITFRAQPHGTFKFLFNSIFVGVAQPSGARPAGDAAAAVLASPPVAPLPLASGSGTDGTKSCHRRPMSTNSTAGSDACLARALEARHSGAPATHVSGRQHPPRYQSWKRSTATLRERRRLPRFLEAGRTGSRRIPLRLLAYVLMPNHWHMVVWPETTDELSRFLQRVTGVHASRIRRATHTVGHGHIYQGRYHAFVVDTATKYLNVVRYVEANPLRAGLVDRAEHWRWSSLRDRVHGRPSTCPGPFDLPGLNAGLQKSTRVGRLTTRVDARGWSAQDQCRRCQTPPLAVAVGCNIATCSSSCSRSAAPWRRSAGCC